MVDRLATRLRDVPPTIFTVMSALAVRTGAVNLGQGFPDTDGPPSVVESGGRRAAGGRNQYAPGPGVPELREAIARHQQQLLRHRARPRDQVVVTAGATEAIAAAVLGLVDPGDEVAVLEPYYDSYLATIEMAGGVRRPVAMRRTDAGFRLDLDSLAGGGDRPHHGPARQHAAQPDRDGARRRPSGPRSRTPRCVTTWWSSSTRSTSTCVYDGQQHVPLARCRGWPTARCRSAAPARRSRSPAGRWAG